MNLQQSEHNSAGMIHDDTLMQVVMVGLGDEMFALDAELVREIIDPVPATKVAGSRPFLPSVINVRGNVIPLADLRIRFGMPLKDNSAETRIVVIEIVLGGDPVPGTSFIVRTSLAIGACSVPHSFASSSSRLGSSASALTSLSDITVFGMAPPRITIFCTGLASAERTVALRCSASESPNAAPLKTSRPSAAKRTIRAVDTRETLERDRAA